MDIEGVIEEVRKRVNLKIYPIRLEEANEMKILEWVKKYEVFQIIDAINIAEKYLRPCNDENVNLFFDKMGGVLFNISQSPIDQKISHIKAISRQNTIWDEEGTYLLKEYINELKKHYTEEQIVEDLDINISKITRFVGHWQEWLTTMRGKIEDVKGWDRK